MKIRSLAFVGILALMVGCGGGKPPSNRLFILAPGARWAYALTGSVTLPASLGGGTQNLQSGSTLTMQVTAANTTDAANGFVVALDRVFDGVLIDGRHVGGNLRLYLSQSDRGYFVHGFNFDTSGTINPANDGFISDLAAPPFKWLYLPDTLSANLNLAYGVPATAGYSVVTGTGLSPFHVPAGDFLAQTVTITERFVNIANGDFVVTNGAFAPETGLLSGTIDARFPDGTLIHGTISLTQISGVSGPLPIAPPGTVENFQNEGNRHVPDTTNILYETDPPDSGPHYTMPTGNSYNTTPIPLGHLVHSMEHGCVILWYDATRLSQSDITRIKKFVTDNPGVDGTGAANPFFSAVIAVPRTDAVYPVIATAWQHRLRLTSLDAAGIQAFMNSFLGKGPENQPHTD